jgi:hypothetical protein
MSKLTLSSIQFFLKAKDPTQPAVEKQPKMELLGLTALIHTM